jgi:hypothetical protein
MSKVRFGILLFAAGLMLGAVAVVIGGYFAWNHFLSPNRLMQASMTHRMADRLAEADADLRSAKSEYDRWLALTELVLLEAPARDDAVVRAHAVEVLQQAPKYRSDWNYGNAIHKANLALGYLALRQNHIPEANDYLLRAGKTPGSPQLNSFGPNMTLAQALFERGERKSLLEYFDLCSHFWEMHDGKLREWAALVKENVEPNFGANLLY